MSPNRLVAALTPLAAVLAGLVANWMAENAPGVDIPASAFEEIFIAAIGAVVAPAGIWLFGWQRHEAREAAATERAIERGIELDQPGAVDADVDDLDPGLDDTADLDGLDDLEDLDDLDDLGDVDDDLDDLDDGLDDEDLDDVRLAGRAG